MNNILTNKVNYFLLCHILTFLSQLVTLLLLLFKDIFQTIP